MPTVPTMHWSHRVERALAPLARLAVPPSSTEHPLAVALRMALVTAATTAKITPHDYAAATGLFELRAAAREELRSSRPTERTLLHLAEVSRWIESCERTGTPACRFAAALDGALEAARVGDITSAAAYVGRACAELERELPDVADWYCDCLDAAVERAVDAQVRTPAPAAANDDCDGAPTAVRRARARAA